MQVFKATVSQAHRQIARFVRHARRDVAGCDKGARVAGV